MAHECKSHHYGDQTVVREHCVVAAVRAAQLRNKVALTESHPASREHAELVNHLTDWEYYAYARRMGMHPDA